MIKSILSAVRGEIYVLHISFSWRRVPHLFAFFFAVICVKAVLLFVSYAIHNVVYDNLGRVDPFTDVFLDRMAHNVDHRPGRIQMIQCVDREEIELNDQFCESTSWFKSF